MVVNLLTDLGQSIELVLANKTRNIELVNRIKLIFILIYSNIKSLTSNLCFV